jgi:hypothetical protein
MKTLKIVAVALCFCSLVCINVAAQNQPSKSTKPTREQNKKIIEKLPGTWTVTRVYDGKQDITPADSAADEQYVFDYEGRYKNFIGTELIGEGSYRISESTALLYLQPDDAYVNTKKSTQQTWKITVIGDALTLQGTGAKEAKRFKYVFARTKPETTSAENN